jgi:hypothetical protein
VIVYNLMNQGISQRLAGALGNDSVHAVPTARTEVRVRIRLGYANDCDNQSKEDMKTIGEHHDWVGYVIEGIGAR